MANLYDGKMAAIFDAMYQTFIDYDEEYHFYNSLIQENNCKTILEIGSGTGNLAKRFQEKNQDYIGLDYSQSMIAIAKERNKNVTFIHGDMREFELEKPVDCILITGRSTSYLITNEDVNNTFDSIYKNLNKDGTLIFDFIDANRFIPFTKENEIIIHKAEYDGVKYYRNSKWKTTSSENFMLEWTAQYYTLKNDEKEIIADDFSTVRVFTLNEIQLFLYLNDFEIIRTIDRKTYAYDTYVIVARKK
ncbi:MULTISPECIES: class I SAM-dependent DNA methyltransferase [Flavobacterium]|uniref:Class I SAM-dependent methyltransferase n=1 Tax=Flavobacterium ranwuense TaxID=2541725 RepID=A0ABY2DRA1_9FLAO|nr:MULTISPECIES: class I SAM-dependent methyltransferase [Flavobacterium]TDE28837.1 class I SAM-dependent methyltransferase [Flavobacterium ranwuense]TDE52971.1 class I SAM-dependent methyltransferase [Flavobacterium sp. GT3P67]